MILQSLLASKFTYQKYKIKNKKQIFNTIRDATHLDLFTTRFWWQKIKRHNRNRRETRVTSQGRSRRYAHWSNETNVERALKTPTVSVSTAIREKKSVHSISVSRPPMQHTLIIRDSLATNDSRLRHLWENAIS